MLGSVITLNNLFGILHVKFYPLFGDEKQNEKEMRTNMFMNHKPLGKTQQSCCLRN